MCGISGIVTFGGQPVAAEDLRRMSSAIAHRGPDAAGYALLEGGKVGLGHVRLSILDLKTGDQPLYDASGSLCIAYNGEIYDHLMLRRELIDQGHRFRTTSDTEVILALYAQHEMRFVEKLNGEFAFLLWDQPRQRLIAVKDRMGIKPLFYRTSPEEVLFCSEAKGILALPRVRRSLSPEFLTGPIFAAFPKAFSAFSDIQCLKPGHLLVIDRQGPHEEEAYWQPSYSRRSISLAEAKEGIRERLTTAVRRRMVADVPVCMYLSGGLDSTLVCALMAQQSRNLKAFNIGFSGSVYDESDRARRIAQHFGVQFEALDCPMSSLAEQLSKTLFHIETFIPNPGSVGKQLLSSLVHAQGYKVALTGEGSDEIFAGYPYFKMEKLWRMMQHGGSEARHAQTLWRRFREIERRSEGLLWNRNNTWRTTTPLFGYPCFTQIRSEEYGALIPRLFDVKRLGLTDQHTPAALFRRSFPTDVLRRLDPLHASMYITLNFLSGHIIPTFGDRVEMANSVEGRPPFLDPELVAFANSLPPEFMMDIDNLREKYILHETFRDTLPPFMREDHKHPFLSPDWFALGKTSRGKELMETYLSQDALRKTEIFNPSFVRRVRLLCRLLPRNNALYRRMDVLLGIILCVQILHDLFIARRPDSRPDFPMVDRSPEAFRT